MYNLIKKLIPASIRAKVNYRISLKIEGLLNQRLQEMDMLTLKKHVHKLEREMFQIYPEIIPFSAGQQEEIDRFLSEANFTSDLNTKISKNDLMYQYIALHEETPELTAYKYFGIGLNGCNLITKLAEHKFGNIKNTTAVLDFASGYGRISRFLLPQMPPQNVWVSDIKPNAVDWQKQHFGVNGFYSSFTPEDIKIDQKFDVIFVGSLFSHLPDEVFTRWLDKLYSMLTPEGVLAVTVHDQTLSQKEEKSDFEFVRLSEDKTFSAVEDSIKDIEMYGITYVSESYMNAAFKKLNIPLEKVTRFPVVFGGTQDLYAINKGDNPYNTNFTLAKFK